MNNPHLYASKKMTILGICGLGIVGGAVADWAQKQSVEVVFYDKYKKTRESFLVVFSYQYVFGCQHVCSQKNIG